MKNSEIPKKTYAAVLVKTGEPLQLLELDIPELKPGQVLVEIAYSGICRSQLNEINAIKGPDPFLPHTLGHEGAGIVLQVGEDVSKVKPGDHVVLSWIKGSGSNISSTIYQSEIGPINSGAISTFMQHAIVSENRIIPINPLMPLKEATLFGCAIPTGAGIILNTCKVKKGESVAIFGCGGVGIAAVIACSICQANPIIVIDINDEKLMVAKDAGATDIINSQMINPISAIFEITAGLGVQYALEATGLNQIMELAFNSIAYSGLCVLAGNVSYGTKISIDPYDLINGKKIRGTWGGETNPDTDIPLYVSKFLSNQLSFPNLYYKEYNFFKINEVLMDFSKGKVIRPLLKISTAP